MNAIRIKRGGALSLGFQFSDDDGGFADLTGIAVASQVRDANDALVATLPVMVEPAIGAASVLVADTSAWPVGRLRCDVMLTTIEGLSVFSETFSIHVDLQVTRP